MKRVGRLLVMLAAIYSMAHAGKEAFDHPKQLEDPMALWNEANWECWRMWSMNQLNNNTADEATRKKFILRSLVVALDNIDKLRKNRELYGDETVTEKGIAGLEQDVQPYLKFLPNANS